MRKQSDDTSDTGRVLVVALPHTHRERHTELHCKVHQVSAGKVTTASQTKVVVVVVVFVQQNQFEVSQHNKNYNNTRVGPNPTAAATTTTTLWKQCRHGQAGSTGPFLIRGAPSGLSWRSRQHWSSPAMVPKERTMGRQGSGYRNPILSLLVLRRRASVRRNHWVLWICRHILGVLLTRQSMVLHKTEQSIGSIDSTNSNNSNNMIIITSKSLGYGTTSWSMAPNSSNSSSNHNAHCRHKDPAKTHSAHPS